ncbi:MAG TPA: cytochrome c oxidase assembly protein [Verrucomicrobiae bacterium]|nr:cytochrome c oxidase assembly protein [Verrucomicrobiae bacterium]
MLGMPNNAIGLQGASFPATAVLLLIAFAYLWNWRIVSRNLPGRVPSWRLSVFLVGLAVLWLAWSSTLTQLTHLRLTAHMVQHLLFMLIAPPLLLLGAPVLVFTRGQSRAIPDATGHPSHTVVALAQRVGRSLVHPVAAASIMVAITIAWHIPSLFALAMDSPRWHSVENFTFLASGILFWWPVVLPWPCKGQWPRWTIPLYLLCADLPVSILSAYLAFCGHIVYPPYVTPAGSPGMSALDDQITAAMLMWLGMMLVFLGAAVAVVVDLLEPSANLSRDPASAACADQRGR